MWNNCDNAGLITFDKFSSLPRIINQSYSQTKYETVYGMEAQNRSDYLTNLTIPLFLVSSFINGSIILM